MNIDVLKDYKKRLGMTAETLAQESGVPLGTINKIFSGETKNPQIDTITNICRVLNCSLNEVTGNYTINKENVDCLNDSPLNSFSSNLRFINSEHSNPKILPLLKTGSFSELSFIQSVLINNSPANADFALQICDDSMFPVFKNGDVIFAKKTNIIHPNDIGVFKIEGKLFVRKFSNTSLLALNSKYESFMLNNCPLESIEGIVID